MNTNIDEVNIKDVNKDNKDIKDNPDIKEIEFNNRKIKFRKWKVKDKKLLDNAKTDVEKRKVYVYNCLENKDEALDLEEYNYVLINIRDFSLDTLLEYEITCPECDNNYSIAVKALDTITIRNANYEPIKFGNHLIELTNIKNQEIYENNVVTSVTMSERYLSDFAMHIKSIDGNDVDYEETLKFLENLNINEYEVIFKEWERKRFKCIFEHPCKCPNCNKESVYDFEDMKDFYPSTWNI